MVKKNLVVSALIGSLLAAMVLNGCASQGHVFDPDLPESETATIWFVSADIKSYNGISVDWKLAQFGSKGGGGFTSITIPGGTTELVFDGTADYGSIVVFVLKDVSLTYNFEPGKIYTLRFLSNYDDKSVGVNIYDGLTNNPYKDYSKQKIVYIPLASLDSFNIKVK